MSILNEIEKDERIKQLEKENLLLKQRILSSIISENTEMVCLRIKVSEMEKQLLDLRRHCAYLKLQIR